MSLGLYVAEVYGKVKPGISNNLTSRITSYTKGNNEAMIHCYYRSVEGYDEHTKNCENHLNRQLFEFLENPNRSHKPSEYVDPKYTYVDFEYVKNIIEDRIKSHPLQMKRLKQKFLPITRYNVKSVMEGILNFPDKYLEDV
jgi:hypothetical protein